MESVTRLHVGQEEARLLQLKADFLILAADSRSFFSRFLLSQMFAGGEVVCNVQQRK